MRTGLGEGANVTPGVAKHDQILAKEAHTLGLAVRFGKLRWRAMRESNTGASARPLGFPDLRDRSVRYLLWTTSVYLPFWVGVAIFESHSREFTAMSATAGIDALKL